MGNPSALCWGGKTRVGREVVNEAGEEKLVG